eukprot:1611876-Alexandrium_andersonii.AAC.1
MKFQRATDEDCERALGWSCDGARRWTSQPSGQNGTAARSAVSPCTLGSESWSLARPIPSGP